MKKKIIKAINVISEPVKGIIDPVQRVCYEPIKTHYHKKYRKPHPKHHSKVFLFDMFLLFILGGLVVTGIFAQFLLPVFTQPHIVSLTQTHPNAIVSGQLTEFTLSYSNDDDQPLAESRLEIRLPSTFVPIAEELTGNEFQTLPNGELLKTVQLNTIQPNAKGTIKIMGRIYAPVGSDQFTDSTMYFWRVGDTKPRRVAQNTSWLVEDSLFYLAMRPEEDIVRGRQVAITIPYGNQDERPVNATIRLTPPDDFVITGSRPSRTGTNEWNLGQLAPAEKGNITVYGFFRSGSAKPAVPSFLISAYITENDSRYLIQELRQNIDTLAGGFEIEQNVTEPSGAQAINTGQNIKIKIRYHNSGSEPINDVVIRLKTNESMFENISQTVWTDEYYPELKNLAPDASGSVMFEAKLKDTLLANQLNMDEHLYIDLKTEAEYFLDDDRTRPALAETSVISLPINTRLGLKAAAFYWTKDGDQVGSGPIPPKPGKTTEYRIFVQVENSLNTTEDTTFEAFLPTTVEWTGQYSVTLGKPPAFLPAERRLVWNLGKLPAQNSQTSNGASFEIALTPSDNNTTAILMKDLKVCGKDIFTGAKTCSAVDIVTNELKYGASR